MQSERRNDYVLGKGIAAARRLEVQDQQFGPASELLLDELALQPRDCVVELGIGAGGMARRVMRRLGSGGTLIGVDRTPGLLDFAGEHLRIAGKAAFEAVLDDATRIGPWLERADVVLARAFLHHVPMAETFLGRLYDGLRPGTRVGFVEPEFRGQLGHLARREADRPELWPLRRWAEDISRFYMMNGISPCIGATLRWSLEASGYRNVREHRLVTPTEATVIENFDLYYDEVRDSYVEAGLMTGEDIDRLQAQLRELPSEGLPPVWGVYCVTARV